MASQSPFQITRTDPDLKTLQKRAKKVKDVDLALRMQAIILMLVLNDLSQVIHIMDISKDTLSRWIQRFNEGGIEGLSKKKDPVDPHS